MAKAFDCASEEEGPGDLWGCQGRSVIDAPLARLSLVERVPAISPLFHRATVKIHKGNGFQE